MKNYEIVARSKRIPFAAAVSTITLVSVTVFLTSAAAAPPFKSAKKRAGVITDQMTVATEKLHGHKETAPADSEEPRAIAKAAPTGAEPVAQEPEADAVAETLSAYVVPEYRIGPGDVLFFRSYNDDSISGEVSVRYDGHISLPLISDISVDNTSRDEATELVRASYAEVFSNPQISLSIRSVGSKSYYVTGNVNAPSEFPYTRPLSIIDAINNAGGLRINRQGGDSFTGAQGQLVKALIVRHTRGQRVVTEYDLQNLTQSGAHAADTPVHPGDTVIVPEGLNLVYFLGEVSRPSVYELADGMTMLRMLAQAGGPRWQSGRLRQAVLMREVNDQDTEVQIVNIRKMLKGRGDIPLQPGDIIYVPQRHFTRSSEFVRQFTQSISPLLQLYTQAYDAANITDRLDSRLPGAQSGSTNQGSLTGGLTLQPSSPSVSGLGSSATPR